MQWFQIRPTFQIRLDASREEVMAKLQREASRNGRRELFAMYGEYGELHLPASEHRLWSPHLSIYIVEDQDRSIIHGRFAPRVDVWTSVWIAYLAMVFFAFFGGIIAYSQWTVGESIWGLIVVVLSLLALLSIYLVAHIGQQWSSDQMHFLKQELQLRLLNCELRSR
jgi:hypothetical protein